MADDEDEDKAEGEPLFEYIKRLETLSGTPRVRVPKEWLDKRGNLFLPPQAIYLVDSEGIPHESADTSGVVRVNSYSIGAGNIRSVQGTFTKNAIGTTGSVVVVPGTNDILYFMYGFVLIGAAHAGAASELRAGITIDNNTSDMTQLHLYDATADVNDQFIFPGLGATSAAGATTMAGVYDRLLAIIPSASLVNQDGGATPLGILPRYIVEYETMADTETFFLALYFYSMNGVACTVAANAGVWA